MKSRITIEVDFNGNNLPVIQVLSQSSDDVRDKLIQSFLQSLQHTSRWCRIDYKSSQEAQSQDIHRWFICPVTPAELEQEIKLMQACIKDLENM